MKNIPLFVNKQSFQIYLDEIKQYYETLKSQIEKLQHDLDFKIKNLREPSNTDEQVDAIYNELSERYQINAGVIRKFFLYSVVIHIYTLIEERLNCIQDFLYCSKTKKIPHKLNNKKIEKVLKNLERKFSIPLNTTDKEFLKDTALIRNILAHVNGNLSKVTKKRYERITKIENKSIGVSIDENRRLDISDQYISYLFENTIKVFNNIYEKIEKII